MIFDSTDRTRLLWAVRVRWLVIAGFLVLALLAQGAGVFTSVRTCVWAAAIGSVMNGVNHWCVVHGRFLRGVTALAIPGDVVLITVVIVATGGMQSPFAMMYVVQVLATAMLVGLPAAVASAVASVGCVVGALVLQQRGIVVGTALALAEAGETGRYQLMWAGFLLYCLSLLAFLGGYIGNRLRAGERDLAVNNERLRETVISLQAAHAEIATAYERLKLAEAQLVHSEKMRALGEFVAGIAHELNNPISFVAANVEHLQRYLGPLREWTAARMEPSQAGVEAEPEKERRRMTRFLADLPEILDDCAEGTRRAREIVDGLRLFSRSDASEQWRLSDVHAGLERALALVRHRLGPRVDVERAYGDLPLVTCLPSQLDQVFVNLLVNATDAIGAAGRITVHTACIAAPPDVTHPGPYVAVTVRDDGMGMPQEVVGRIFDPFFTTKEPGQGTGLGLSVSYRIVDRHGGTITVDSTPGDGSAFTVLLPVRPPAAHHCA